ncbi:hypothetical protein OP127_005165, partial [Salmonella enterica]|nr:hypothetical protein [Salmonella enterica]EKC4914183.1 hypothetical protein [Salmonella enterica]EKC4914191.1 hypothetical protein [Salmonella enterica]
MLSISHQIFLSGWMKRRSAVKNNTIEIYRRRIAIAALERMKRKTGAHRLTVSMPDDNIQFIDIDEEA